MTKEFYEWREVVLMDQLLMAVQWSGVRAAVFRPEHWENLVADFDFATALGNARFPNPFLTASGCAGSGKELSQFFDLNEIGAVVTKSIMVKPRSGRPTPRMAETPSGMLNSIGLQDRKSTRLNSSH